MTALYKYFVNDCTTDDNNINIAMTLYDTFNNFFEHTDSTIFTVKSLIDAMLTSYSSNAFHYDRNYYIVQQLLIDDINDILLKHALYISSLHKSNLRYYQYDLESKTVYSIHNAITEYVHSTKATYNITAYINQYIDFYSNI